MPEVRIYVGPWIEFALPAGAHVPLLAWHRGRLAPFHPDDAPCVLRFVPQTLDAAPHNPSPERAAVLDPADAFFVTPQSEEAVALALDHVEPFREKAWLFAVFAPEIDALRQAVGVEPCVRWGVLRRTG